MGISIELLISDLRKIGVSRGDTLFVRADLNSIGLHRKSMVMKGEKNPFLGALLGAIGDAGTLVSLAYTRSFFLTAPKDKAFDIKTKSYAGALPNIMLQHPQAYRSRHPMNSIVAIGPEAESIIENHDENAYAYEPIRRLVELDAKMVLIGIVNSSPGFTTAHLAELDLGLYKRVIFPKLNQVYFRDQNNELKLFRRKDVGLCSQSYRKFYSYYVDHEILNSGKIGHAYSILVSARKAFEIEKNILTVNPQFNICDNPNCFYCNARRWDRIHHLPIYIMRNIFKKLTAKFKLK